MIAAPELGAAGATLDEALLAELAAELPDLSSEELRELDALLQGKSTRPLSFVEFVNRVNPRFVWYDHCQRLAAVLQRVADDEIRRLLISMPPRHGKSELVTRLFPAYYLYRHPERWAAIAAYAAELAHTLSRNARDYYTASGRALKGDAAAVKHWETGKGGGLWASGVRGPATGKGWHLGIIDDPIKDAEEALSETIGRRNRDWYGSTWLTREEPGGAMIIVQTRWPGPADLIGHVLEQEAEGEEPERWHVVVCEAIKEPDAPALPETCTLEPDPRAPGEALCAARYPLEKLQRLAKRLGDFFFGALFQQRPRARSGGMFPREKAKIVAAVPLGARHLRYWDKAGTEGAGAYTAGVRMAVDDAGFVYVVDVLRKQLGSENRNPLMRQTAQLDGVAVPVWGEQEPGSGGKESAELSIRNLAGFDVHMEPVTGDKTARAQPFSAQWQAGNVRLVLGAWNKAYLDELEAFPGGRYKDQVDASSGAYNKLALVDRYVPGGTVTL